MVPRTKFLQSTSSSSEIHSQKYDFRCTSRQTEHSERRFHRNLEALDTASPSSCCELDFFLKTGLLTGEAASQREAVGGLTQKLAKAEAHENSLENELHRLTLQLTEKSLLLDVLQREKEQAAVRVKELEAALQAERESGSRAAARQEAAQERLAQAHSDAMLLRQQLEEAQNKGSAKERAVTDAQERFSDILSKLRSDCEERVQLLEERNKELAKKAADLCEKMYKLEEEKNDREVRHPSTSLLKVLSIL